MDSIEIYCNFLNILQIMNNQQLKFAKNKLKNKLNYNFRVDLKNIDDEHL